MIVIIMTVAIVMRLGMRMRRMRRFVRTVRRTETQPEQTVINNEDQVLALYFDVAVRQRIQQIDAFAQQSLDVIAVFLGGQAQQLNERMSQIIAIEGMGRLPAILGQNALSLSPLHVSRWWRVIIELTAIAAYLNEPLEITQL